MSLQVKFTLYSLIAGFGIVILPGYMSYKVAETEARDKAYHTCYKILASVEASRTYVREILRPVVKKIVSKNDFIPEAMSASFVARNQFEYFLKDYPNYHVKFASTNPRNPINQADKIEIDIINQFDKAPDLKKWQGVTNRNDKKYYTVAKPFRFKKNCMVCHSEPENAPRSIVENYGDKKGFWRQIGDVTMYSISVPIEVTTSDIWRHTSALVLPLCSFIVLMLLISSQLFKEMVAKPIINFSDGIRKLSEEDYKVTLDEQKSGELKTLAMAFNTMTTKLFESNQIRKQAEDKLHKAHDNLEKKVQERTSELLTKNNILKQEIKQKEEAQSKVKVLTGLLPICSHCKKIRDDKGYWNQLESYIYKYTDAEFSHSICKECAEKHYPGMDVYED